LQEAEDFMTKAYNFAREADAAADRVVAAGIRRPIHRAEVDDSVGRMQHELASAEVHAAALLSAAQEEADEAGRLEEEMDREADLVKRILLDAAAAQAEASAAFF
jgi:hypothetical protein